ncbi:flagellar motor protein MotB [bacterium]|nr:flagellar motor protein MotB [bacterium]
MAGRKAEEKKGGAPEWMFTFSDMMSLLLCFFVLLFSLSTIEKVKFTQTIASIQGALGRIPNMYNSSFIPPTSTVPQKVEPVQRTRDIERAKEAISERARSILVSDEQSKEVIVEGVKEGVRFSLAGRVLFEQGFAVLSPEGKKILQALASEILNDFPKLRVSVEGHTDDTVVPPNLPYQDNWRLAEARAYTTMLFLRDKCNVAENRLSYTSCGKFRPRFPNDTPENQALNRRVEVVLLQGSSSENITGVLEGSSDSKVNLDEQEFVPLLQEE